jgi:hypothetical protein
MSNAKSISIGPLVVADIPKKIKIPMSSAPKMALAIKNGIGLLLYLFMRLIFPFVKVFTSRSIRFTST